MGRFLGPDLPNGNIVIRRNIELGAIGHTRDSSLVLITCSESEHGSGMVMPAAGPARLVELTITLENGWIASLTFKRFA